MQLNKFTDTRSLFEHIPELISPLFEKYMYPWQVLPEIKNYLSELVKEGVKGYKLHSEGVLVGENVRIADGVTILPPTVIGHNTEIRPGAFIRGSVYIGEGCVIGNSTELKNCVLFDKVQVPHYNYVGDSILGNHSHLGASAIASNLKSTGGSVFVSLEGGVREDTGLRKLGAILGDGADIGCGSVLNPGTIIGKNTTVYPLIALRGSYPPSSIVKSSVEIVNKT